MALEDWFHTRNLLLQRRLLGFTQRLVARRDLNT
jgi:hypothetical protein